MDENKMLINVKFSINSDSSNISIEKIVKNEMKINEILKLTVINTFDKKNARTIVSKFFTIFLKFFTIFLKIVLLTVQSTN